MSKVTDQIPRCVICGEPIPAGAPILNIQKATSGPRGGAINPTSWGQAEERCFAQVTGGPRAVLQSLRSIAQRRTVQPADNNAGAGA